MRIAVVGGTETIGRRIVAALWREATGHHTIEVPIPLPGKLGGAVRAGRLTCANPEVRGTQAFAAWLQANGHLD
jgi:uncharacterized protein YbjT (DUF2867 family)